MCFESTVETILVMAVMAMIEIVVTVVNVVVVNHLNVYYYSYDSDYWVMKMNYRMSH